MKLAVVGATGLVGETILKVLEERNFPVTEVYPVASAKSVGKKVFFRKKSIPVISIEEALEQKPEVAIFSAGAKVSKKRATDFQEAGTYVIDNSSAWRMDENIKLIVPEINAEVLEKRDKIIANPNCSTIQMVVALNYLHRTYTVKRLVISTYQSVTGTGTKAVKQLENERCGMGGDRVYPHQIDLNVLPHAGDFDENGYTTEETKLVDETKKIFNDEYLQITATVVRVPVFGGHSESVNVEFEREFEMKEILKILQETPGVVVQNEWAKNEYPMPVNSENQDSVFVGRIRRDFSQTNCLNLWIVADNLRKGAATNAVQIAEFLVEKKWI